MNLDKEVKKVEGMYMRLAKPFTALDIGNQLKKKGINVRQREVSKVVRDHFANTDNYTKESYTRTLAPVKDDGTLAFVYFHIDGFPDEYDKVNQDALPFDPNKPSLKSDDISDTVSDNDSGSKSHNKQNSINQTITATLTGKYVASKNKDVYHDPNCSYALRISIHNAITFNDGREAVSQNYRKCKCE